MTKPLRVLELRTVRGTGGGPDKTILQGTAPTQHNFRFELEFESEELRQQWIASTGHQRVWPQVERCMTTLKDYPVVLYDEV